MSLLITSQGLPAGCVKPRFTLEEPVMHRPLVWWCRFQTSCIGRDYQYVFCVLYWAVKPPPVTSACMKPWLNSYWPTEQPFVGAWEGFSATCLLGLAVLRDLHVLIFYLPEGHCAPLSWIIFGSRLCSWWKTCYLTMSHLSVKGHPDCLPQLQISVPHLWKESRMVSIKRPCLFLSLKKYLSPLPSIIGYLPKHCRYHVYSWVFQIHCSLALPCLSWSCSDELDR